jgi:hypothetical protein
MSGEAEAPGISVDIPPRRYCLPAATEAVALELAGGCTGPRTLAACPLGMDNSMNSNNLYSSEYHSTGNLRYRQ